ncbi:MAG: 23S rRNA (adenine(2503)-C(2))-methyltransferase RlmN [Rikenellaceae bacterium]|nr:23S rRNA (adenine(2503)-C(2))-methyltransferase RlmN [Rikenellaceae bacterium]
MTTIDGELKIPLFGKTLPQLQGIVAELGMPRFTAGQLASWLYSKRVASFGEMSDISVRNRGILEENYVVGLMPPERVSCSADGTKKYLFPVTGAGYIESAYIPDRDRATLCVSSQVGCRMGCLFCMTGKHGLSRNLTAGEILNQVVSVPESDTLTNIVYMGMGEPLDNTDEVLASLEVLTSPWGFAWSPTRITVSTAGLAGGLKRLIEESRVHLAVSLHNPFPDQRAELMPIERGAPVAGIVELLKGYDWKGQRRLSFEYILLEGINDSPAHIKGLARLLDGLRCRINLIRFHRIPGSPFYSPGDRAVEAFRDALSAKGITTTVRASRGEDIQAACGLLSTRAK